MFAALVALGGIGCGARSELWTPEPEARDCEPLRVGFFGNPGAYDTLQFQQWLTIGGAVVTRVQTAPDEAVALEALEPFDVVVLDWLVRDYSAEEAATLAEWVAAGNGLISMTGWNNDILNDWRPNSLLAPLGVAYSGPLISGPVTEFEAHPITEGLESVVFEGGYAISEVEGGSGARTPIAFLAPGGGAQVVVGYAIEAGSGRAFVWGDEWIEFLTTDEPFQPRVWVQAFGWVAPGRCTLLASE